MYSSVQRTYMLILFLGGLFLTLLLFSPIEAVAWHCVHGNHILIGDESVKVPLLWWRAAEASDGTIELKRSRVARLLDGSRGTLEIRPVKKTELKSCADYERAFKKIDDLRASGRLKTMAPEMFIVSLGSFYCFKSVPNTFGIADVFCNSPDIPLRWNFIGSPEELKEAESIIQSLERSTK